MASNCEINDVEAFPKLLEILIDLSENCGQVDTAITPMIASDLELAGKKFMKLQDFRHEYRDAKDELEKLKGLKASRIELKIAKLKMKQIKKNAVAFGYPKKFLKEWDKDKMFA